MSSTPTLPSDASPWTIALAGTVVLAVAMGIGRFAFSPLLPVMQAHGLVTLEQGGWLAAANYVGYLIGALSLTFARLRSDRLLRAGLSLVVVATFAMALDGGLIAWLGLRFVAGVASAWLLIGAAGWAMATLQALHRPQLGSVVFAGVGVGIALAGLTSALLVEWELGPRAGWVAMGAVALLLTGSVWRELGEHGPATAPGHDAGRDSFSAIHWRLIWCYGAFGLGYIVPATFLPVLAREVSAGSQLSSLAWPAFGVAAALSTWLAEGFLRRYSRRSIWTGAHLIMALGIVLPLLWRHPAGVALAALCVGGTFMVITMVGLQEARVQAGRHPQALMGAMTAAFALGQLLGPLIVAFSGDALPFAMLLGAAALVASAGALMHPRSLSAFKP